MRPGDFSSPQVQRLVPVSVRRDPAAVLLHGFEATHSRYSATAWLGRAPSPTWLLLLDRGVDRRRTRPVAGETATWTPFGGWKPPFRAGPSHMAGDATCSAMPHWPSPLARDAREPPVLSSSCSVPQNHLRLEITSQLASGCGGRQSRRKMRATSDQSRQFSQILFADRCVR